MLARIRSNSDRMSTFLYLKNCTGHWTRGTIDIGWGVVHKRKCHVTCTLFYYTSSQVSFTAILLLCVGEREGFQGATDGGHYTSMKDPFNLHQRWEIRANQFTVKNCIEWKTGASGSSDIRHLLHLRASPTWKMINKVVSNSENKRIMQQHPNGPDVCYYTLRVC